MPLLSPNPTNSGLKERTFIDNLRIVEIKVSNLKGKESDSEVIRIFKEIEALGERLKEKYDHERIVMLHVKELHHSAIMLAQKIISIQTELFKKFPLVLFRIKFINYPQQILQREFARMAIFEKKVKRKSNKKDEKISNKPNEKKFLKQHNLRNNPETALYVKYKSLFERIKNNLKK